MKRRLYISGTAFVIPFLFFLLFISSCKTTSVNNGHWFQKRKYNKGWHVNLPSKIKSSNEDHSKPLIASDSIFPTEDFKSCTWIEFKEKEFRDSTNTISVKKTDFLSEKKKISSIEIVRKDSRQIFHSRSTPPLQIKKVTQKRAPPQWLVDLFSQSGNAGLIITILCCFIIGCGFLIDLLWKKKKGWAFALAGLIIAILVAIYLVGGAWAPQFYALFLALTALLGLLIDDGTMTFGERFLGFLFILAVAAFYYWIYIAFYNAFWMAILLQCALYGLIILIAIITDK